MLELVVTGQYKKDCRRIKKRGNDMKKLDAVIEVLCTGEPLDEVYLDHPLHGESKGCHECHVEPDWLLKYRIDNNHLFLVAMRTGTHSDLRLC